MVILKKSILNKTHGSKRELAIKSEIEYSAIRRLFNGQRSIKFEHIEKIMKTIKTDDFNEIFERRKDE